MTRPWLLPFIVLALIVPPVAGFALAGPPLGLAIGALEVTAILVVAARARFDGPIEVAGADRGYALLVLAVDAVEEPRHAARIAEIAGAGTLAELARPHRGPEVLVVAPATNEPLAEWLSDLERARFDAQRRLALSLAALAAAGVEARGHVGDPDPVQAVEDELRSFPAHELVLVAHADTADDVLGVLERRLDLRVSKLELSA